MCVEQELVIGNNFFARRFVYIWWMSWFFFDTDGNEYYFLFILFS